jgi:glucose-6-phosphate 1-dehydrogenase
MIEPGPCYFVIFGATGNLASRKLLPALYDLEAAGKLHADLRLLAFARRAWTRDNWLEHLHLSLNQHLGKDCDAAVFERFAQRFDYVAGDLTDPQAYRRLLDELSKPRLGTCENIVFYLAIKPSDFLAVIEQLDHIGISRAHG